MPRVRKRRHVSTSPSTPEGTNNLSDDEDPENGTADLTLDILAKAEQRGQDEGFRSSGVEDHVRREEETAEEPARDFVGQGIEAGVELEEGELNEATEPVVPVVVSVKKRRKLRNKEKRLKKEAGLNLTNLGGNKAEPDESVGVKLPDVEESLAMRKLLRAPRYFDPPEEQGESCSNCGQIGHRAADCSEQPRQKPCYVCGNFGHDGYECPERTECFECGKSGHVARNCPNKHYKIRTSSAVCLLCGRLGHDASSCTGDYDHQDYKQVRCYICKRTGHLCCVEVVDATPTPVSCYQCGELGHTGVGCINQNLDRGEKSSCFKCGQEGHFARDCNMMNQRSQRRHSWPAPWPVENGRYGDQDSPFTPACHIRPVSFTPLQQPPSSKRKHHEESRSGSNRKRSHHTKEVENDRWTPKSSGGHRKRSRD